MRVETPPFPFQPIAEYRADRRNINDAILRVLESGAYILGPEVEAFEREFAAEIGAAHAIGVASGTDALVLALRALGIADGDTVITASFTAVATVAAIELAGAQPLLVDIDPSTFTIDPNKLEATIRRHKTLRIKAVIPVHLYGHPADMAAIMDIAKRHGHRVVEDCAQSHGARFNGKTTGAWGDAAAFSFYPTKNLGGIGDGGAVVTGDPSLAERVLQLRQYGWKTRYISEVPGMNSRLDEMQAAILRIKCRGLREGNQRRRDLAGRYDKGLTTLPARAPTASEHVEHVYHQYVVRAARRDALKDHLQQKGVPTAIHFPLPVHAQPAYAGRIKIGAGGLGESEQASREVLSLPMHPHLDPAAIDFVVQHVNGFPP